jgi:integrase/recombinase XerD
MIMLRQTKGGEQRGVPVPKLLMWALNQIRPERADGLIFRSPVTGGPIVNVRRAIAKAKEAAGITKRVTPHILRHSFATALTARNYNLALTQAWLGHKKESTTADMYAHIQPEHLRGAEKVLGLPARFPVTTTKAPMTRGRKKR